MIMNGVFVVRERDVHETWRKSALSNTITPEAVIG